jgi:hypothetical protein
MKKINILAIALLWFAITAMSGNVPRELAEKVAIHVYVERSAVFEGNPMNDQVSIRSAHTEKEGEIVLYYVFHMNPDGFVIVAGQEAMNPVLGYSFEGTFDVTLKGCNLRWWMDTYRNQARLASENDLQPSAFLQMSWTALSQPQTLPAKTDRLWGKVGPLLTTQWDQDYPYNYYCPEDSTSTWGGHALAGCAATTCAQLGYYYRWPEYGKGRKCYLPQSHPEYGLQCADFENTRYRYEEMVAHPNPKTVNLAIAEYIFHLGVSMESNYGPNSTGPGPLYQDSSTYFFKFLPTELIYRNDYSDSSWIAMLKSNLDRKIPLNYAGQDQAGISHSFVCDGYQDSAYFHFNMGWDGESDGYYFIANIPYYHCNQLIYQPSFPDTVNYSYPLYLPGNDTLTAMEGSLTDGSDPLHDYLNNLSLSWLIDPQTETDTVETIRLEFSRFNTHDQSDKLVIYDGGDMTAPILAELSGDTIPPIITTTGNKAFVKFTSDGSGTAPGFLLNYYAKQPAQCNSITVITDSSSRITDGSGKFHYQNSMLCKWRIQPEGCDSALTLRFTCFDTEPEKDVLEIYDLATSKLLAKYSGHYAVPPPPLTVPDGKAMMIFRSNSIETDDGWEICYGQLAGISRHEMIKKLMIAPNPANNQVDLGFTLSEPGTVHIGFVDIFGRLVKEQTFTLAQPGEKRFVVETASLPPALYIVKVRSSSHMMTGRVLIAR